MGIEGLTEEEQKTLKKNWKTVTDGIREIEAKTGANILLGSTIFNNAKIKKITVYFNGNCGAKYEMPAKVFITIPPKRLIIEVARMLTIPVNSFEDRDNDFGISIDESDVDTNINVKETVKKVAKKVLTIACLIFGVLFILFGIYRTIAEHELLFSVAGKLLPIFGAFLVGGILINQAIKRLKKQKARR